MLALGTSPSSPWPPSPGAQLLPAQRLAALFALPGLGEALTQCHDNSCSKRSHSQLYFSSKFSLLRTLKRPEQADPPVSSVGKVTRGGQLGPCHTHLTAQHLTGWGRMGTEAPRMNDLHHGPPVGLTKRAHDRWKRLSVTTRELPHQGPAPCTDIFLRSSPARSVPRG